MLYKYGKQKGKDSLREVRKLFSFSSRKVYYTRNLKILMCHLKKDGSIDDNICSTVGLILSGRFPWSQCKQCTLAA